MARVLFTSNPAYGHVLPMLPLLRAAARAGHDVRLATGPDLIAPLATRGLDAHPVGPTWAEGWSANQALWADPALSEEHRMMGGVVALFGRPAIARLADLDVMARDWRPDLIVHEVLELAGSLLARTLDVPGVVHGIGPMFPFYAQLIGHLGEAMGEPDLWALAASEQALDLCPSSLQPEGPPPWQSATPLRPSAGEPGHVPDRVAAVLAADSPVAYFTLGTVKNADASDFKVGLAALDEYDGVVIATTGRRLDPQELGALPANAVVEEFVPQAAVLGRADLLVSHSGSGTMLGGLVHGVPQVALPRGTDQPQNAALIAHAGAGVVVAPEDYAVDTVRAAVREVTSTADYRSAAERVRDEITAMPDADAVWAAITPEFRASPRAIGRDVSEEAGSMRVLCASTAGAGHFSPLVPWIELLVGMGHQVLVVGPPALGPATARWEFVPGGAADPAEVGAIMARVVSMTHEDAADLMIGEVFTRLNSGALLPAMREAIAEFRPDVVLRDPAEFGSSLCSAEAGIRQVRIGHGLSSGEATLLHHARPILEEWSGGLTDVVAGSAYFTRFPESVDPAIFPATRRYREAPQPTDARAQEPAQVALVYVTLGTVTPTIPILLPWYSALLEALSELPVRALMTTGRDLDPARLGPVPVNVEVTPWADQRSVLAGATAVVHHGGSGTVLSSLECGCPQVVVPLFADQGDNAAMVERAGLGLAVADLADGGRAAMRQPRPEDAHRIHAALQRVLADEEMRSRSRQIAAEVSQLPALGELSFK